MVSTEEDLTSLCIQPFQSEMSWIVFKEYVRQDMSAWEAFLVLSHAPEAIPTVHFPFAEWF